MYEKLAKIIEKYFHYDGIDTFTPW